MGIVAVVDNFQFFFELPLFSFDLSSKFFPINFELLPLRRVLSFDLLYLLFKFLF